MTYSSISCCYVSTKHIAYFLSLSLLCLFSLFPYLYVGVPWPWADRYRWACLKNSTTTSALESAFFIYFTPLCHFHFILYYDTSMSTFRWTCILTLCFDNEGVHHLVVGSEPTHCDSYLSLCILRINACLYPPFGGVILYGLCRYYAFIALLFSGRCSRA